MKKEDYAPIRIAYLIYQGTLQTDELSGIITQDKFHSFDNFTSLDNALDVYEDIKASNIRRLKRFNSGAYLHLALYNGLELVIEDYFQIVKGRIN